MDEVAPSVADTPAPAPAPLSPQEAALEGIRNAVQRQENGESLSAEPTPQEVDTPIEEPTEGPESEGAEDEPEAQEAESESEEEATDEAVTEDEDPNEEPAEVPDTLQGLAEHFDVDPAELAGHIELEYTDDEGNPQKMSFAEAVRGTLRQEDYTRKTDALAQEREAFNGERAQVAQAQAQRTQQVDWMFEALRQEVASYPNDNQLMDMLNPESQNYMGSDEVNRIKLERDRKLGKVREIAGQRQADSEQQQAEADEQTQKFRAEQLRRMTVAFPEVSKDPAKQVEFDGNIREFLTNGLPPGFTYSPEQVEQFLNGYNASQVVILDMAMKYAAGAKASKTLTKKYKATPRTIKPGGSKPRVDPQVVQQRDSLHRLRTEKSKDSAINHIRSLIRSTR